MFVCRNHWLKLEMVKTSAPEMESITRVWVGGKEWLNVWGGGVVEGGRRKDRNKA